MCFLCLCGINSKIFLVFFSVVEDPNNYMSVFKWWMYIFLDGSRGVHYGIAKGLLLRFLHRWGFDILEEELPGSAGVFRVYD